MRLFSGRRPQRLWSWWLVGLAIPSTLLAQAPGFQLGAVYQCPAAQSFKVFSCAGSKDADACDVQSYNAGQPSQRGKAPYAQVAAMARLCHPQSASEAQSQAKAAEQPDANGFKVGDTVQILTGFGWVEGRVLARSGDNYKVHAVTGVDVTKTYPSEVRRIGAPTAGDRARGVYQLHDKVQVLFQGQWVESEIVTTMGMDYQVKLPGNRVAWATAQNLRPSTAPPPAPPKGGQPPKPGLASCAGKFEGRYGSANFAGLTIIFRSGKATLEDGDYECWTGGGKVYIHKPGESGAQDLVLDINNDGTLDSPLGELKKKGN
jgi:hypothetical protein